MELQRRMHVELKPLLKTAQPFQLSQGPLKELNRNHVELKALKTAQPLQLLLLLLLGDLLPALLCLMWVGLVTSMVLTGWPPLSS